MKKISLILLAIILCFALVACGRRNKPAETTLPSNENNTIPDMDPTIMDPTLDTNIPDPDIDSTMPSPEIDTTAPELPHETTK